MFRSVLPPALKISFLSRINLYLQSPPSFARSGGAQRPATKPVVAAQVRSKGEKKPFNLSPFWWCCVSDFVFLSLVFINPLATVEQFVFCQACVDLN